MNINELLDGHQLPALPMRAWLSQREDATPGQSSSGWVLEGCRTEGEELPRMRAASLHLVNLEGVRCLAIVGHAGMSGGGQATNGDERALVYLLNPADRCVWDAIDSWRRDGVSFMRMHGGKGELLNAPPAGHDQDFSEAREVQGNELESDLLAGRLLELISQGRLEAVLASQLGVQQPLRCAIVETPMLCQSMTPVDPREWEAHLEHQHNKWQLEGIGS